MFTRSKLSLAVGMIAAAPLAALAETGTAIDTAAVTAQYGEIETALVAVGGVILAAAALAVGFKWIKGMVFS